MQQPGISGDADANDSQSSVQKIIHNMLMSPQFGGGGGMGMGTTGGDVKNINGMMSTSSNAAMHGGGGNGNILVGTGVTNGNPGIGVSGMGNINNGFSQSAAMPNGIRATLGHSLSVNGRVGMAMTHDQGMNSQQDVSNQLLNSLGAVDAFNSLQFDWKPSP